MKVAIHQPHYLPYLGYLEKVDAADCFIVLDTVQYVKHEWQNRNRLLGPAGSQWLTVPVVERFPQRIDTVAIAPGPWARKHAGTLQAVYGKAPYWPALGPALLALWQQPWTRLVDLSVAMLDLLCARFGIPTPRVLASTLPAREDPTLRLIDLCHAVGGTTYLAGAAGPAYLDRAAWADAGIEVLVQDFQHPTYPQGPRPFVSHLAAIDLYFHCGPAGRALLQAGRRWAPLVTGVPTHADLAAV